MLLLFVNDISNQWFVAGRKNNTATHDTIQKGRRVSSASNQTHIIILAYQSDGDMRNLEPSSITYSHPSLRPHPKFAVANIFAYTMYQTETKGFNRIVEWDETQTRIHANTQIKGLNITCPVRKLC